MTPVVDLKDADDDNDSVADVRDVDFDNDGDPAAAKDGDDDGDGIADAEGLGRRQRRAPNPPQRR